MSDIRARIRSRGRRVEIVTWLGFTVRSLTVRHWYLEVLKGDVVVNEDDCSDFASLLADAERRVIRYRGMQNAGVRLRPWSELVEEARL